MPDFVGEKTEAPTPRRRQESRQDGNVARSGDLMSGVMLLAGVLLLAVFARQALQGFIVLVESMLTGRVVGHGHRADEAGRLWAAAMGIAAQIVLPIGLCLMGAAMLTGVIQSGFLITLKPLAPRAARINPARGLQNIFSMRGMVRLMMSLLKVAVVVVVAVACVYTDLPKLMSLVKLEPQGILAASAALVWSLALKIALVLLLLGLLDYFYQRWQHEQDMRMSRHEVKEELKQMEGDPLMKQRRAQVARQLLMQRIAHDVPKADVVVTNPTHYAVALKYDNKTMSAPKVVAKGADLVAVRIRQIAAAHRIPIVERPPLARAIYRTVEIGREIPAQFYAAVAEILAYVYRLKGRKSA